MDKEIHFPSIKGKTPEAPRMSMDEYFRFVVFNMEHAVDQPTLEKQLAEEKRRMKYTLFRILKESV